MSKFEYTKFDYIKENLCEIHDKINNAKAKRDTAYNKEVRLMAVTKTMPVEKINFAVSLGIDLIGENRADELLAKYDSLEITKNETDKKIEIHFIGNLQTNKVRQIIDKVDMIQSVNSVRLAEEINKRADMHNKTMDILVEINIGGEESKIGVSESECCEFIDALKDFRNLRVCGLMTIPPFEASLDKSDTGIKKYFQRMCELRDELAGTGQNSSDIFPLLSMGMSEDFEEAVEYGSNIIRIGTKIFGER